MFRRKFSNFRVFKARAATGASSGSRSWLPRKARAPITASGAEGQEGRRAGGRGYSVANWKDDAIYEYAYTIRNFRRVSFVIRHIYTYRGYIVRPNYRFRLPFPFEMRDKVYIWQVFRQHFYYSRRVMPPARWPTRCETPRPSVSF